MLGQALAATTNVESIRIYEAFRSWLYEFNANGVIVESPHSN